LLFVYCFFFAFIGIDFWFIRMSISVASELSNRRPYEAHGALFSNTDLGSIPSSPKSNAPLGEESDTMVDQDAEGNQDDSISSKVVFPSDALTSNPDGPGEEPRLDSPVEGSTSPLRVRFRPRVRITSGLNHHRRRQHQTMENHQDYLTYTPSSSISGSPSSSISAPLRTPLDEEVGKPGWGTLGQRVALFAKQRQYPGKTTRQQPEGCLIAKGDASIGTERTPLLKPSLHFILSRDSRLRYLYHDSSDEEDTSRLIDQTFGPWPTRLLNHHWWWWQLEPLTTCRCCHDYDGDEGCS